MNEIILSIVIPTYNGGNFLDINLRNILPQVVKYVDDVELLICNNASTDNTLEIIEEYDKEFPNLFSIVNREKNIGAEENFADGVDKTKGKFVLLLGDDDILSPNFLDVVVPILSCNLELGILHYNRIVGPFKGIMNFQNTSLYCTDLNKGIIALMSFPEFIKEHMHEPSFMSSVIFNRNCWHKGSKMVSYSLPYYGYYWFAKILFGAINCPCTYYYFPLVIYRATNTKYIKMATLNCLVGFSNIFKDLDKYVNGVYDSWDTILHNSSKLSFWEILGGVCRDPSFYYSKRNEFKFILSKGQQLIFILLVKLRPTKLVISIYSGIIFLVHIRNKLLMVLKRI